MTERALRAALRKLAEADASGLPGSRLSPAQKRALDQFTRHTRCVGTETRGRGVVYTVRVVESFQQHLRQLSPQSGNELAPDLPARAGNIAVSRGSKTAQHAHKRQYVLLRAHGDSVRWSRRGGQNSQPHTLDLSQATALQGVSALAIGGTPEYKGAVWLTEQPLWLVENQALFDRTDWLEGEPPGTILWYRGQLSEHLLSWLSAHPRSPHLWLFPDYDGVGLMNFARLRAALGDRAEFWLLPDWSRLLSTYGNNTLWQNSFSQFEAAAQRLQAILPTNHPTHDLIAAMRRQGLALEQEVVWLV